jgi:hypothetical protein
MSFDHLLPAWDPKAGRGIAGALGVAVSAGLPPSKAVAQKKARRQGLIKKTTI